MEVNTPHGPIVLIESVDERAHPVVPQLNDTAVQAGENPWPPRVKAQPLHPITLRLELGQHCARSSQLSGTGRPNAKHNPGKSLDAPKHPFLHKTITENPRKSTTPARFRPPLQQIGRRNSGINTSSASQPDRSVERNPPRGRMRQSGDETKETGPRLSSRCHSQG